MADWRQHARPTFVGNWKEGRAQVACRLAAAERAQRSGMPLVRRVGNRGAWSPVHRLVSQDLISIPNKPSHWKFERHIFFP